MGYIYKIYNSINGKIYIGQTVHEIDIRFKQHVNAAKRNNKSNIALYNAMNKYGSENFYIEMIEQCNNEQLDEREIYWISFYNSYNEGYNMTLGGDGGKTIPTAIHREINGTPIQQYNLDGDFIAEYISSGDAAEQTGTQQTEINRCCTRTRNTYSANGFIWKRKDDHTSIDVWVKENKIKNGRRAVEQYNLNGDFIQTYNCIMDAKKAIGISLNSGQISLCCNKHNKSAYGYIWKFADDPTPIDELINIQNPKMVFPREVKQYDLNDNLINVFSSIKEASRQYSPTQSSTCISEACNGKQKTAYGYVWKFKENIL